MQNETHHHQCPLCDHIWEHERKDADNPELYSKHHTCPSCHSYEQRYICDKDGKPIPAPYSKREEELVARLVDLIFGD